MDRYEEIALEIKEVIKDDLFDSEQFDVKAVVEVLKKNFNITYQIAGETFLQDISMFNTKTGDIIDGIPGIMMTALLIYNYEPLLPGIIYPNYDIENRYIGYTRKEKFYRMRYYGIKNNVIQFLKKKSIIDIQIIFIYAIIAYIVISWLGII